MVLRVLGVHHRRRLVIGLVFAGLLAAGILVVMAVKLYAPNKSTDNVVTIQKPPAQPTAVTSKTLFFGNAYFGRYINDWSMASSLKYAYPFSRLSEFNRPSYNAWIAGLECPSVSGVHLTSAEEDATLSFNCNPSYLPEAAKWITAFTLANNHTDNQGTAGLTETRQHLQANGTQYFGNPDPNVLSDVCEVVSLPATVSLDDGKTMAGKLPVAMCGYHGVFQIPSQASVDVIKQYSPYMTVIAMPHMGKEYVIYPDQIKTTLYRSLIDAGADMVLGDHPHWIQTSEAYKGHPIIYSMGNFLFDQQDTAEVTRSAAVSVLISAKASSSTDLAVWLKLGETCGSYHDDCLAQIKSQHLQKLSYSYKLSIVGTDDSNKIVRPASAALQQKILQRLDWAQTIKGLHAPYSGV